jgi:hypothetical protein
MAADTRAGGGGYEKKDADVRLLAWLLAGLLGACLLVVALTGLLTRHLVEREARRSPAPSTLAGTRSDVPPEPRLQNSPFDDLKRLHAEEEKALNSYGWVDRKARIARIPIERALEIASQGGLPHAQPPAETEPPKGKGR